MFGLVQFFGFLERSEGMLVLGGRGQKTPDGKIMRQFGGLAEVGRGRRFSPQSRGARRDKRSNNRQAVSNSRCETMYSEVKQQL